MIGLEYVVKDDSRSTIINEDKSRRLWPSPSRCLTGVMASRAPTAQEDASHDADEDDDVLFPSPLVVSIRFRQPCVCGRSIYRGLVVFEISIATKGGRSHRVFFGTAGGEISLLNSRCLRCLPGHSQGWN
eukprot:GHVT01034596.1.p1 GENE.GHVT01034596.1~~GHVT01034596.1.p1  ORF type:complete len:130 (-),score=7.46 GHVT01034596.1:338-727(-)